MRYALSALALLLAACAPAAPPPQDAAADASGTGADSGQNPDAAALDAAPQPGQWTFRGDDGVIAAGFGAPESEYLFLISCEAPTGRVTFNYEHELAPDQDTTLRVITPSATIAVPARSFNEGLPSVSGALDGGDGRLAALRGPIDRFAVEAAGEISVLPWDESVARALAACA